MTRITYWNDDRTVSPGPAGETRSIRAAPVADDGGAGFPDGGTGRVASVQVAAMKTRTGTRTVQTRRFFMCSSQRSAAMEQEECHLANRTGREHNDYPTSSRIIPMRRVHASLLIGLAVFAGCTRDEPASSAPLAPS